MMIRQTGLGATSYDECYSETAALSHLTQLNSSLNWYLTFDRTYNRRAGDLCYYEDFSEMIRCFERKFLAVTKRDPKTNQSAFDHPDNSASNVNATLADNVLPAIVEQHANIDYQPLSDMQHNTIDAVNSGSLTVTPQSLVNDCEDVTSSIHVPTDNLSDNHIAPPSIPSLNVTNDILDTPSSDVIRHPSERNGVFYFTLPQPDALSVNVECTVAMVLLGLERSQWLDRVSISYNYI